MMGLSLILLGSNLGDREMLIKSAIDMIGKNCGNVLSCSRIYETEPWGFDAENNFLNQIISIQTDLRPHDLLKELLSIEITLGRDREHHYETYVSRPIDLDILYYDDLIIEDSALVLPHPRLHLRRFTLEPLCDIAPKLIHPILRLSNEQLLQHCEDSSVVNRYI
mgnify:CR=1 FL=1